MSVSSPARNVSRFTAFFLGFVVFVCVAMIGGTGYLKYQLDRAQTVLAAPDNALNNDQDVFVRLRRNLGYGGFLGLAQKYVSSHDASGFAEMKLSVKEANEIVAHLPDKTTAETRHELAAIAAVFDAALKKISAPAAGDLSGEYTAADLAALYAAMPILDARVASATAEMRLAAQNKVQFWAMLLTLVSWCSLIISAACAAGIYLTLRDKHSAPMRALAQSIQNMARGDMRTAIWGIERQDVIGELARAMDIARYHFSHLPDLSLLSEQGPVRMRFEGGSRSLFEAMMKAISTDSESIREQSVSLATAIAQQKDAVSAMTEKVDVILQNIARSGHNGDALIRQAIGEMVGSAEGMKNAHAHAADQLNRLIPHIEERAQGLAEITHIAGKQISQTLQSLSSSEYTLKNNAENAKETLNKLSSTADDLGERLFGAINLLQASGKVMAETTENIKSRLGLTAEPLSLPEISIEPWTQRLDEIKSQLAQMQQKIEEPVAAPQGVTLEDVMTPLGGQLDAITGQLNLLQIKLDEQESAQTGLADALEKGAAQEALIVPLTQQMEQISGQLATLQVKLDEGLDAQTGFAGVMEQSLTQQAAPQESNAPALLELNGKLDELARLLPDSLRQGWQEDLVALQSKLSELTDINSKVAVLATSLPADLRDKLQEQMMQLSAQKEIAELNQKVQVLTDVNSKVAVFTSALPGDLRQVLREEMENLPAQTDVTPILDKLSALQESLSVPHGASPELEQQIGALKAATQQGIDSLNQKVFDLTDVSSRVAVFTSALPGDLRQALREEMDKLPAQADVVALGDKIGFVQADVSRLTEISPQVVEQVGAKLEGFEASLVETRNAAAQTLSEVSKPVPPPVYTLPPELQKQMLDQWFQMSAQLEATRASMIQSLNEQIESLEARMIARTPNTLTKSTSDYAMQVQIETQTQILTELVSTLGILDAHMQQIRSEMGKA